MPLCSDCASPCASSPTNYVSLSSQPHVVGRRAVRLGREGTRREDIRVQRLCQSEGVAICRAVCSEHRVHERYEHSWVQPSQYGRILAPRAGEMWVSTPHLGSRAARGRSCRVACGGSSASCLHPRTTTNKPSSNDTSYSAQLIEA